MNDNANNDPRLHAIPDIHGHAKGEHKAYIDERPIPLSARMLFLWFYHACRRGWPRFLMVSDHMNYLTFEDPAAINLVRRALKLAQAGDLYGAAETASVEVGHAAVVSEGLRRGMRYSIGAEVDNDPRSRPDAQNIVDAMKPDGMIRSVHFLTIDHPTLGPNWNWPFDNPEFVDVYELIGTAKTWELYMATLLDAVERLPGNILGHFYVPALFGHWPDDDALDGYENQIVDACEARGMAIELNTRFLYRDHSDAEKAKYLGAYRRLLSKCKAKNVGVAVGSDAHSPKDQGGAFEQVLALLDECAINELVFPIAGRLARVALRVERKAEPVPEPASLAAEERKPVRKARASEIAPPEDTAAAMLEHTEPEAPAKSKARPKRSRAKAAHNGEAAGALEGAVTLAGSTDADAPEADAQPVHEAAARPIAGNGVQPAAEIAAAPVSESDSEPVHAAAGAPLGDAALDAAPTAGKAVVEPAGDAAFETPAYTPLDVVHETTPTAEAPTAEAPTAEASTAEASAAEPPTAEPPTAEPPAAESPAAEDPAAGALAVVRTAIENVAQNSATQIPVAEPAVVVVEGVASVIDEPLSNIVTGPDLEPILADLPIDSDEAAVDDDRRGAPDEHEALRDDIAAEPSGDVVVVVVDPAEETLESTDAGQRRGPVHKARRKAGASKNKLPAARAKSSAAKAKPTAKKAAKPASKPAAKTPAKKAAAKKGAPKKTAALKPAAAKKAAPKKAAVRKSAPKKVAVRAAGAKKSATKKNVAKKASSKKSAQRRR